MLHYLFFTKKLTKRKPFLTLLLCLLLPNLILEILFFFHGSNAFFFSFSIFVLHVTVNACILIQDILVYDSIYIYDACLVNNYKIQKCMIELSKLIHKINKIQITITILSLSFLSIKRVKQVLSRLLKLELQVTKNKGIF